MKCLQMKKVISQYVDGELSLDEEKAFAFHLKNCAGCRKVLEEVQAVHEMLASAERFSAPTGFAARAMDRIELTETSGFLGFLKVHPIFLRAAETAFALVVVFVGMISGSLLVADRTYERQTTVRESFLLDLFQATPPNSIGGVYVAMTGASDER